MGVFDTYGDDFIQLKVGDTCLSHYKIGAKAIIPDGIYIANEGIVVVDGGFVVVASAHIKIFDKRGWVVSCDDIVARRNPVHPINILCECGHPIRLHFRVGGCTSLQCECMELRLNLASV